jgi:peptide/nickel transport system substrate-binding protein
MPRLWNHCPFLRAVLFCLTASLLLACAPAASPAAGPAESATDSAGDGQVQRLRVAIIGDESTLTPYTYVTGYPGWNLLTLQYDTLYQLDMNGVPKPWLATSATVSEDGLTVTLALREDVTWHDGQPLTAEDVKFTFDYFKANQQGRFTRDLRPVDSAVVDDEGRVVVTLSAPAPSLELGTLADVPILPKHIWEGVANPAEHSFEGVTNIGTGPYKLVEYQPEQFYRFAANADYFAGAPAVAELVAIKFADDAGALAALRGGEVDMIVRPVAPEQIDLLSALPGMKVAQGPLFTTQMLTYDMTTPPFNRLEVRQAMALAIDRQDIIDTVYLGAGTLGSAGWIHPQSPLFNDAVVTETNLERAAQLLEEAGITDSDGDGIRELDGTPLSFEFLVNGSDSLRLRIAELVSQMLKQVGIEARVAALEQTTWEEAVWPGFDVANGRNYDMAMWGWSAPIQADATRIASLVHSDPAIGTANLSGYQSAQADEIAAAIVIEVNPERSAELIRELQTIIAADLPFILLLYPDGAYAYNAGVYDGWAFMTGQGVFHKLSFLPEAARP